MKNLFLPVVCLVILSACAVPVSHDVSTVTFPLLAPSPPPPPQEETPAVLTDPLGTFWKLGYWLYDGREYKWVPGHVAARPHPTAVWSSERWEKRIFGWAFVPGHWR